MVSKIKEKSIANNAITPAKLSSEAGAVTGVKVSSIAYLNDDTAANTIGGDVITVTGAGFTPTTTVYVDRTQAGVVTYVSNTQITFSSPAKTAGSYILYLYNADGGSAAYIPGINYSGVPAWSTASGSIGTTYEFTSFTGNVTTLSATSDTSVYYLLNSGSLPTGASLNANTGVITGNTGVVSSQTTYNFVIEAKDQENQGTLRNFSITINPDTVTWNSPAAGATLSGQNGVSFSQVLNASSAASRSITYTANTLPAGLNISGNTITGTPSVIANTTSLFTATSSVTNRTSTRTFLFYISSANLTSVEYLVVAGGGTGGSDFGAGGGAGGLLSSSYTVTPSTSYTITVGGAGNDSTFGTGTVIYTAGSSGTITAYRGGAGGGYPNGGNPGGSGGGQSGGQSAAASPGAATYAGQGNTGGARASVLVSGQSNQYSAGGGGGAGAVGGTGTNTASGSGGAGAQSSITGVPTFYAGGGGGGGYSGWSLSAGSGGSSIGGAGSVTGIGSPGSTNTGSGGGGSAAGGAFGNSSGGSGIVIIAYPSAYNNLASISGGLTYTLDNGVTRSGYKVYKFTAGTGTISW